MKTNKSITVAALNITMHPHDAKKYVSLIKKAEKSKTAIRVSGDVHLQLVRGIYSLSGKDTTKGIYGEIAKFTDIPKDAQWINLATESAAGEEEMQALEIPDNLKPNYQSFTFIFFPESHKFYYEQKNGQYQLSPNYVEKLLVGLFSMSDMQKSFGKVDVTVIPHKDKVDQILNIPELRTLTMRLTRPNPDDIGDDIDREILKDLDSENIGVQVIQNKAVKGKSLKLNDNTKNLAKVAAENGFVEATGFEVNGAPISDSTRDHPLKLIHTYNSAKSDLLDALHAASLKIAALLTGR